MTQSPPLSFFDGHSDFLLRLHRADPADVDRMWLEQSGTGQMDLPRMEAGGLAGGLFAIYVPSPDEAHDGDRRREEPPFDLPLPAAIPEREAQPVALRMAGLLYRLERLAPERFTLCRSVAEIVAARETGRIAGVMHMEGAEAIGADLDALHLFHAAGLRSLGPVWSRPTIFGHGVPFRFPGDPDTGPGLTRAGADLVRECNALGILIDLSHLNAAGVADVARISTAPLVATHSCVHAICPTTRNLTDRQLAMIRDTGGMVGLNFATGFLDPGGRKFGPVDFDVILRHIDHLIAHLGEDHVGFGSDFDGAEMPDCIGDVRGLPALGTAMAQHGFDAALRRKLAWDNWLGLLERTWGA